MTADDIVKIIGAITVSIICIGGTAGFLYWLIKGD